MDWQEPVALAVVAAAALLLIRMQVRSYRRKQARACGSDCGCASADERKGPSRAEDTQQPKVVTRQ